MTYIGEQGSRWKGRDIRYYTAHDRVRSKHGSASSRQCSHCDEPAAEWAYDHSDPDVLHDERGRPYSPDPDRYIALCRLCHHRFDGRSLDPCGTINAYQRHHRRGETPCVECKAANAADVAARKAQLTARETPPPYQQKKWTA